MSIFALTVKKINLSGISLLQILYDLCTLKHIYSSVWIFQVRHLFSHTKNKHISTSSLSMYIYMYVFSNPPESDLLSGAIHAVWGYHEHNW